MIVHDVKQNSPEWLSLRAGRPTASAFSSIVTPKTRKLSASADRYMSRLLLEYITGAPIEEDTESKWQQHGHDTEPEAVASYTFETGRDDIRKVGFVTTDDALIGASPDRAVGNDGLLEIKSPAPWIHLGYLRNRDVDEEYQVQLDGQLWICEREWVDIQAYSAGLPSVIIHVTRDEERIGKLATAVREFTDRMLAARADLEKRFGPFLRVIDTPNRNGFEYETAAFKAAKAREFGPQPDGTFVVPRIVL